MPSSGRAKAAKIQDLGASDNLKEQETLWERGFMRMLKNSVMAFRDSQNILELWQEVQVELYTRRALARELTVKCLAHSPEVNVPLVWGYKVSAVSTLCHFSLTITMDRG